MSTARFVVELLVCAAVIACVNAAAQNPSAAGSPAIWCVGVARAGAKRVSEAAFVQLFPEPAAAAPALQVDGPPAPAGGRRRQHQAEAAGVPRCVRGSSFMAMAMAPGPR
jgi:hypothetical protein